MRCATHPDVETNLRCGKCGQPICPRCLVHTPVGARCPRCANVRKLPVFEVSGLFYVRAIGAGLGISAVMGALWWYIAGLGGFLYLDLILGLVIGYTIGEVVSLSVNRKRGRGLQAIAGVGMVVAYVVSYILDDPSLNSLDNMISIWGLAALALGIFIAVARLR